jgi:hypothetical protein
MNEGYKMIQRNSVRVQVFSAVNAFNLTVFDDEFPVFSLSLERIPFLRWKSLAEIAGTA